jgi:hypothetical protein
VTSGLFAEWQPRYAEVGVATFPVRGKSPAIKGYMALGLSGSRKLVGRFGQEAAFGLEAEMARIVVVDVDTPDERILAGVLDRYGPTPFIVRSGSGNHQAWYKRSNERRSIRPDASLPIDILGRGVIVAPPSIGKNGTYQIIQGCLDDLAELPVLRSAPAATVAHKDAVRDGCRNNTLFEHCMAQARFCDGVDALIDVARTTNDGFMPPLSDPEVVKIARSAWNYEDRGQNWCGAGQRVIATHAEVDGLMQTQPDAFLLLMLARRYHWGREFVLANAMAKRMPGGGWSRKRLATARRRLEEHGAIEMVSPACRRLGPAIYRLKGGRF